MGESKHVYRTLDGLRGIAALAVVMHHTLDGWGGDILPHAYLAVDMFFVMSGIVIAHAYEHRFKAGMTTIEFMRLRLIRLYPLYLLGTVVALLGVIVALIAGVSLVGWTSRNFAPAVIPAIFMLPSYKEAAGGHSIYPINLPAWSLFLELISNLAYALLFPLLTNRMLAVVAGVAAVALVVIAATGPDLDLGASWETLYGGIPRVFWSFPLGVLFYRCRDRLPKPTVPPVVLCLVTIAVFAPHFPAWLTPVWDLVAITLMMPAICIAAISNEPQRGGRVFLWLGAISYPVYMLHFGLFRIFDRLIEKLSGQDIDRFAPWAGISFLVFMMAAASVADKVYDRPFRRFLAGRRPRSPGLATTD